MDVVFEQPEDFATDESFINYCFHSNEEDVLYWEKWLQAHPDKHEMAAEAREIVYILGIRPAMEVKESEFEKLNIKRLQEPDFVEEAQDEPGNRIFSKAWVLAGIAVLVIGGGMLWRSRMQHKPLAANHTGSSVTNYTTAAGQKRSVLLDDGTRIELNAASKLTLDQDFGQADTREVTLIGEAYFNVAKDADKPFIIHTAKMDITVLGTTFNVKDYPDDKTGEAALISGSIAVELRNDSANKIILKPDEKVTAFAHSTDLPVLPSQKDLKVNGSRLSQHFRVSALQQDPLLDSGYVSTAWMEGKLVFHDESFEQLALQIERKYNVRFQFAKNTLKTYRFTGVFSTETIEQALHALQLTSPSDPFDYRVERGTVFITERKK